MADKDVIIHGVNVSECDNFDNISELCSIRQPFEEIYHSCNEYENCYFKQLQRKTAECEELKATIRNLQISNTKLQNNNQQLDGAITKAKCYEQALNDIKKSFEYDIEYGSGLHRQILDIISKAKDGKNE